MYLNDLISKVIRTILCCVGKMQEYSFAMHLKIPGHPLSIHSNLIVGVILQLRGQDEGEGGKRVQKVLFFVQAQGKNCPR